MDVRLRRLSVQDGASEDVVYGVVEVVLDQLPLPVQAAGYAKLLRGAGFCFTSALELLDIAQLVAMGVPPGHAVMVHAAIRPRVTEPGCVQGGPEHSSAGDAVVAAMTDRRQKVPEFPELQKNGLPLSEDLRAHVPAHYAALRARGVGAGVVGVPSLDH
jgi:hypothetical protein